MAYRLKTFHRKTRKGSIVKVVREHYLREDIHCGIADCSLCLLPEDFKASFDLSVVSSVSELCPEPHFIILDSGVLLHQSDILEDEIFADGIIPQTAWEEVKRRSPPAYKKMRDLVFGSSEKRFFVFPNEFHKSTYVDRKPKQTSDERATCAIQKTVQWYTNHLASLAKKGKKRSNSVKVCLLSDNADAVSACREEGLIAFLFADYVKKIPGKPELADKIAAHDVSDNQKNTKSGKLQFEEHKSLSEIQSGLRDGRYKQGSFQVSRDNYLEAYVYAEENSEPIFVQGLMNCNRAVHDDLVAIEMLPEDQWTMPARLLKLRDLEDTHAHSEKMALDAEDDVDPVEDVEMKEASDIHSAKDKENILPTGRVIGIIRRNWRPYCGLLRKSPVPGTRRHLFVPAERRIPHIRLETRQADLLEAQRLLVSVDCWPRDSRYPKGHFVRSLGPLGDRETENEVLLLEHDIPHARFSQSVLKCLPSTPWEILDGDRTSRTDLRHLDICSVDPPGCTDIDDALHCRKLDNGRLEVGVHIADVSHFVRPDTEMDKEAASRGTTVYLVDQRIDMLPELLSSNLCSLRGGEERFAFSVIWELTPDGEVLSKKADVEGEGAEDEAEDGERDYGKRGHATTRKLRFQIMRNTVVCGFCGDGVHVPLQHNTRRHDYTGLDRHIQERHRGELQRLASTLEDVEETLDTFYTTHFAL